MANLTRDQIVSEGQLLAGRDNNETASAAWLQRWLDSVAASWAWPILHQEAVGIPLSAGATTLALGGGSGVLPVKVLKIQDNLWLYNAAGTVRRRLTIRHQLSAPYERTPTSAIPGTPASVRIFTSTFGAWVLYFDVPADQDYLLSVAYIIQPPAMALGSQAPWYPNDETMVQLVAFKNHEFFDGRDSPLTVKAQQDLAAMVAGDRIKYGAVTGINDVSILDPTVFRAK